MGLIDCCLSLKDIRTQKENILMNLHVSLARYRLCIYKINFHIWCTEGRIVCLYGDVV